MKAAKREMHFKQLTAVDENFGQGTAARRNLSLQQTSSGLIEKQAKNIGNSSLALIPAAPSTLKKKPKREGMLRLVGKIGADQLEIEDEEQKKRLLILKKAARRMNRGEFSQTVVKMQQPSRQNSLESLADSIPTNSDLLATTTKSELKALMPQALSP